jgi:hypothetical protein
VVLRHFEIVRLADHRKFAVEAVGEVQDLQRRRFRSFRLLCANKITLNDRVCSGIDETAMEEGLKIGSSSRAGAYFQRWGVKGRSRAGANFQRWGVEGKVGVTVRQTASLEGLVTVVEACAGKRR